MNHKIDWEDLLKGYNRIYKANFKSVKHLLTFLYKKDGSIRKISKTLGVSFPTVSKKLKEFTQIKGKGGNNRKPKKSILFLNIPEERMSKMTRLEIARECNMSIQYVDVLLRKNNRKLFSTVRNNTRHGRKKYNGVSVM